MLECAWPGRGQWPARHVWSLKELKCFLRGLRVRARGDGDVRDHDCKLEWIGFQSKRWLATLDPYLTPF